jgi:ribose transport system substrate-binding protein
MIQKVNRSGGRRWSTAMGGVALAIVACAAIAGCGSSGGSGGTSAAATPASGAAATEVKAAEKIADAAEATPAKIPLEEPLKAKPPAGETMVYLESNFEQAVTTRKAIEEAVKPLEWNLKTITFKAEEPATLISAFKQALQYEPVGVSLNGTNSAVWQSVIPEYEAAGVPIVEGLAGPQELNGALVANLWNEEDIAVDAKILANWMTADSGAAGKAIVLSVPELPILSEFASSFSSALKEACKGCDAETVKATTAQITNPSVTNGLLVSAAEKNPEAEYIITCDGALNVGLPAALSGAGLEGLKVAGAQGSENSQAEVAAGKASVYAAQNFAYYGWQSVDAIARHLEGMKIAPGDGGMPHQLITKENVGTPTEDMKGPKEYQAEFAQLWKVE